MTALTPQSTGEGPGQPPPSGLRLTPTQRRILDEAVAIEFNDAVTAGALGFSARIWTQLALPYKNPGPVPRWERKNGTLRLIVRPATITGPDGTTTDGYPFGVIPRYLLLWMATEAVKTQDRTLTLGSSVSEFVEQVGLSRGGAGGRRLKDQMHRLLGSTMQIQGTAATDGGVRVVGASYTIASSYDLWIPTELIPGQGALWQDSITLSEEFFADTVASPVPVDLRAMRALSGAPMRMDIYVWLTYRMSYLRKRTTIPWELLALQFGGTFTRLRAFREAFADNLRAVSVLYPAAKFEVTETALVLWPSPPSVSRREAMRIDK